MLRQHFATQPASSFNIVLTNGFADNVIVALDAIGLTHAFRAIVDTRGGLLKVGDPPEVVLLDEEHREISQYGKHEFANGYIFDRERSARTGISNQGVARVIYVDDSVESQFSSGDLDGPADVVELPKEGCGLNSELCAQVLLLAEQASSSLEGGELCMIYDFDCTLTTHHMFKALYQSKSRWAVEWAELSETESTRSEFQERLSNSLSPRPAGAPTEEEMRAAASVIFKKADCANGGADGMLSKQEIKLYLKTDPEAKEVLLGKSGCWKDLWENMDKDGDNKFDEQEFGDYYVQQGQNR
eukprot:TRINITY_DN19640_c0_g1_i2.p1 TRINITY_DN19640_c0_g1~~TRINITY_DN19640_c0_g1_i2.p1  ORF type:complete len:300 (+),score=84.87 TRINITY_DN19640_c0_g1_i2:195-1094(+)